MTALTTADLLTRVREKTDESNEESVSDATILRAVNEAQRNLVRISARSYDQMYMSHTDLTTDGTDALTIPEDAFDRRLEFLEVSLSDGVWRKLVKEKPSKVHNYRRNTTVSYPSAYTTKRENIMLLPKPKSGLTIRVWYTKRPGDMVTKQGRIIDFDSTTLTLDTLGSGITSDVDSLGAFFSIIDGSTGLTKGSYQASSVNTTTNIITLKTSSLDRTTVAGRTISTTMDTTVEKDDYVCGIAGTCVLELLSDYSDYLVAYAVVEVRRSLREDTSADYAHMKSLEQELETMWSGRDLDARVTNRNGHWSGRTRYRRR